MILPSTARAEPERTAEPVNPEPANPPGSVSPYPRLQFRHVDNPNATPLKAKRKADAPPSDPGYPKRPRSVGVQGPSEGGKGPSKAAEAKASVPGPPQKATTVKRTIDFNEVYQDGDAEHKHMIIEYPGGEDKWYILKCDEHGVHFNCNPLHGAAKHLHSAQHGNLSKEHALAIRELGHQVWDCTPEYAAKNNAVVKEAFTNGYMPYNENQMSKTARRSMGLPVPGTPRNFSQPQGKKVLQSDSKTNPQTPKAFEGVVYPVDFEVYLGFWSKTKTRYAVMLLPWGSFDPTLTGSLSDSGLLDKPPKCYVIDRVTREITGWAEGFEDGGRLVTKREFPVMYFDGQRSVGWLRAEDLSIFDFEDAKWKTIPHYHDARNMYANARPDRYKSYEKMQEHYAEQGLVPKRYSSVREPRLKGEVAATPSGTNDDRKNQQDNDEKDGKSEGDGKKSTQSDDTAQQTRHPPDVEMPDVPRAGQETDSDQESGPSVASNPDSDVDMGNTESRRTSASNNGGSQENGRLATGDVGSSSMSPPAATKTATGAPGSTLTSFSSAGPPGTDLYPAGETDETIANTDKGKSSEEIRKTFNSTNDSTPGEEEHIRRDDTAVLPSTEGAPVKGAGNGLAGGQTNGHSSPPLSRSDSVSRRDVTTPTRRSRSLRDRSSIGATTSAASGFTKSPPSPGIEDSIVYKRKAPAKTMPSFGPDPLLAPATETMTGKIGKIMASISRNAQAAVSVLADGDQPEQSITAAPVTVAAHRDMSDEPLSRADSPGPGTVATPAPMPTMSESSSAISSPLSTPPTPVLTTAAAAASSSSTRTSTPTVLRPEEMGTSNRWQAVRRDSGTQAAPSQPPPPTDATPTEPPKPKEASVPPARAQDTPSRTSTPLPEVNRPAEYFELAFYDDEEGNLFQKQKDGPFLRLVVDKQTNIIETTPGQSIDVAIDLRDINRFDVDMLDNAPSAPSMVTILLREGASGPKKLTLVFETNSAMGREETGRIHARRLCGWLKRVNRAAEYRNGT